MNAFDVTIPWKSHFQGTLFQGGKCASIPYGVWRAARPDGLSMAGRMPALAWVWGTGPMIGFMPKNDCLPLKGPMSAQEFLKYLAATMKVEYVSDEPVPAELNATAQKALQDAAAIYAPQYAARNQQAPKNTRELARANVSYKNGTFTMKGRLDVLVDCSETISPGTPGLSNWSPGHPVHATTGPGSTVDKKSTRLNSSHLGISYAVFCLKKNITIPASRSWASPRRPVPVWCPLPDPC